VFKLLSAFAGRLGGRLAGAVEVVVPVGGGGAVMVIGGVVVVGAGGAVVIGECGMVADRVACTLVTLLSKADAGLATAWAEVGVAGIVEPMTRPVDTGTTAFDAALAIRP